MTACPNHHMTATMLVTHVAYQPALHHMAYYSQPCATHLSAGPAGTEERITPQPSGRIWNSRDCRYGVVVCSLLFIRQHNALAVTRSSKLGPLIQQHLQGERGESVTQYAGTEACLQGRRRLCRLTTFGTGILVQQLGLTASSGIRPCLQFVCTNVSDT